MVTKTARIKVYVLYPHFGGFSVRIEDYYCSLLNVAAYSIRQAYAVAHNNEWIEPPALTGIVSTYNSGRGTRLWCGCSGHSITGGHVNHGDGVRALRKAIAAHDCPREPDDLRSRLKRYLQHQIETETA